MTTANVVKGHLLALPEVAGWPEMAAIFDKAQGDTQPDWELPWLACQAVGGEWEVATVGVAAIACMQVSIILVDDILDEDPRGEYRRLGVGPASNLALAYQAAAFALLDQATLSKSQRASAASCLARIALATAVGQNLDVQNLTGEENYWRIIAAKSTPFYGAALELGALLGGADSYTVAQLYRLGVLIGEMIQIGDDLTDALQTPANPDWRQGRNNLLILYALTADYPERGEFTSLLPLVDQPEHLERAQSILVSCGAVSYGVYQLLQRYQVARGLLEETRLVKPEPLIEMLTRYGESLASYLNVSGANVERELR